MNKEGKMAVNLRRNKQIEHQNDNAMNGKKKTKKITDLILLGF